MDKRIPKPGEFYLHFKKKIYQIITVAIHTETGKKMVVYQAMYGRFQTYVRELEEFNSLVDKKKYPECTQLYRFQKLTTEEVWALQEQKEEMEHTKEITESVTDCQEIEKQKFVEAEKEQKNLITVEHTPEEEQADPRLMAFLDADSYDEKYRVLVAMGQDVDDRIINDMAVVLDVVIPEGSVDERMRQLKNCVETKRRYESNRLR